MNNKSHEIKKRMQFQSLEATQPNFIFSYNGFLYNSSSSYTHSCNIGNKGNRIIANFSTRSKSQLL